MVKVAEALDGAGLFKDGRVHLLTVSLDPARDTPAALTQYMKLYRIDPARWTFLTGEPAAVAKVHAAWGMWVRPGPAGQLDHPSRVFLLDRHGRIREIYNLDFFKPAWVLQDVRLLLDEAD
jgi:protein SCO1/2